MNESTCLFNYDEDSKNFKFTLGGFFPPNNIILVNLHENYNLPESPWLF